MAKINHIIKEQEIITTYNLRQQEQHELHKKYLILKKKNPEWGHKRLGKILNVNPGRVSWWYFKKSSPVPTQTVNWLKAKKLLPLYPQDPRASLIARILGTTFGDGGIFKNLNAIFLSSSELEAVKQFGNDLKIIFGKEIALNSRVIEGGEYGHSWCYQNTNRKIIRMFQALGAPIGKKSEIKLEIPNWIFKNKKFQDNFFSAFFGNEIGIPKIHINKKGTNSLDIGIVCKKELLDDRINFFNNIKHYLNQKGISTNKIYINKHKQDPKSLILKLPISVNFDNLMNFNKKIVLNYTKYKSEKLITTLSELKNIKLKRFNLLSNTLNKLTQRNYSTEWIKHNLRLTDKSLKFIQNREPLKKWN